MLGKIALKLKGRYRHAVIVLCGVRSQYLLHRAANAISRELCAKVSRTDLRCRGTKPRSFDITANIVGLFSNKEIVLYRVIIVYICEKHTPAQTLSTFGDLL